MRESIAAELLVARKRTATWVLRFLSYRENWQELYCGVNGMGSFGSWDSWIR